MAKKVRVITDSTADIPEDLRQELEIGLVPLKVHLGSETYLDRVDIQPQQFYQELPKLTGMPTTSQPSPLDFEKVYRESEKEGATEIISIHLSSAFSGTYQSAVLAQSMVEDELNVVVLDSKTASFAIGILVVEVARAAKMGKNMDECVALANRLIKEQKVYFLVDTLEYLQKGGRIGKASAIVGSLLNIKPILSINTDGVIYPADKVRGKSKAWAKTVTLLKDQFANKPVNIALMSTHSLQEYDPMIEGLKKEFSVQRFYKTEIGPVIGAHVGPGTTAVVVQPTDKL